MSPELVMFLICGLGFVGAATGLVLALRAGHERPVRAWAWVIALIIIGLPAAFLVVVSIGSVATGGLAGSWIVLGTAALWCLFVTAIVRPRWGAWVAIATALALPALLAVSSLAVTDPKGLFIDVPMMLGFYSVRTLIAAGLLLWATTTSHRSDESQIRQAPQHSAQHA